MTEAAGSVEAVPGAKVARILVADDDAAVRDLVREVLHEYAVEAVADGNEALRRAREESPDLIILDVKMPGADGFVVCDLLKRDEATRRIPVLMLTGQGGMSQVEQGFSLRADDYIVKPFRPRVLEGRVRALLGESSVRA